MSASMELLLQKLSFTLSWVLVHSLWQAALVFAVAILLTAIPGRNSARVRYGIYWVAYFSVPVLGAATFSHYYTRYDDTLYWLQQGFPIPDAVVHSQGFSAWINMHSKLIVTLWGAGFLVSLVRFTGAYVYCRNLVSATGTQYSKDLQTRVSALACRLDLKKTITAKISTRIRVPCVIGHLKPVILFPSALLTGLNMRQMEAVLLHELAHIQRNDYLVGLVENLVKTLYFFNPFARFLLHRINSEREHVCDDAAVKHLGDALLYARTLEKIGQATAEGELAMAISGRNNAILTRVKRQFENSALKQKNANGVLAAFFLFLSAMLIALNAIGGDMPKIDYEGIESLSNTQVAELIVLARDSIKEQRENNEGIRDETLDNNSEFLKLSFEERQVFLEYLQDELWRFFNMDGWDLKLQGATQAEMDETLKVMFEELIVSRIRHLGIRSVRPVHVYEVGGQVLFEFTRIDPGEGFHLSINREFLMGSISLIDEGGIDTDNVTRKESGEVSIEIPWNLEEGFAESLLRNLRFPIVKTEPFNSDMPLKEQDQLKSSYLAFERTENGVKVIFSKRLLDRFRQQDVSQLGNGYVGIYSTPETYEIPMDFIKQNWMTQVMMENYLKHRSESTVNMGDWAQLSARIENLPAEDKAKMPTDRDFADLIAGMEFMSSIQMNDLSAKSFKFRYLSNLVTRLENNDESTREMLTHRPLYSSGRDNKFVAMRSFLPLESGEHSFDLDIRNVPFETIYSTIQEHCPELSGSWTFTASQEIGTVVFNHLNCERVVSILNYIEKVKSGPLPNNVYYQ